jgi:L-threonylcarbamoyladenylate synthase
MPLLTTDPARAAQVIAAGGLAALPTETVYGLGADATNRGAVARIYATKGRPADHPLIVHIASLEDLQHWSRDLPDYALALANECWPGPLTLVVPRSERAGDHVTGGQPTVGLRIPNHPLTLEVLRLLGPGAGVAAPSANRFGRVSPTTAAHVAEELLASLHADTDTILDGGPSSVGVESTIVDATGEQPVLLRPGAVTVADITRITGLALGSRRADGPRAPGMLASHYAPQAELVLVTADELQPDDARVPRYGLIAPESVPTPVGIVRLVAPVTADDYARGLYAGLRKADALDLAVILCVAPALDEPLSEAILDRLTRAATR